MDEPDDLKILEVAAGLPDPDYRMGPPFPLNAAVALVQLVWLILKWVVRTAWAGAGWLRRFLSGERQAF